MGDSANSEPPESKKRLDGDDARAIYVQHCEEYRHQDALKWSRMKTVAVLQGAILFAAWNTDDELQKRVMVGAGTVILLILMDLIRLDKLHADLHLSEVRRYETNHGWPYPKPSFSDRGTQLLVFAVLVVIVFNAWTFAMI